MKSRNVQGYLVSMLLGMTLSAPITHADDTVQEPSPETKQVVLDIASTTASLNKGYFYLAPLDFMPSKIIVGQPEIVGVDVVGAQPFPHVHLIGLNNGTTNLVVFDQSDKIRVSMKLSVADEVQPRVTVVPPAPAAPTEVKDAEASTETNNSAIYSVRVFRALVAEEISCTDEGCVTPSAKR